MTDEELLRATAAARRAAHDAPMNPYRLDADGHRWVEMVSYAWADRSREWIALLNECDRRGLKRPAEAGAEFKATHPSGESDPAVTPDWSAPATSQR